MPKKRKVMLTQSKGKDSRGHKHKFRDTENSDLTASRDSSTTRSTISQSSTASTAVPTPIKKRRSAIPAPAESASNVMGTCSSRLHVSQEGLAELNTADTLREQSSRNRSPNNIDSEQNCSQNTVPHAHHHPITAEGNVASHSRDSHSTSNRAAVTVPSIIRRQSLDDSSPEEVRPPIRVTIVRAMVHHPPTTDRTPQLNKQITPVISHPIPDLDEIGIDTVNTSEEQSPLDNSPNVDGEQNHSQNTVSPAHQHPITARGDVASHSPEFYTSSNRATLTVPSIIRRQSLDDSSPEEVRPPLRLTIVKAMVHHPPAADCAPQLGEQITPGQHIVPHPIPNLDEIRIDLPGEPIDDPIPTPRASPPNRNQSPIPGPILPENIVDLAAEAAVMQNHIELERRRQRLPTLLIAMDRILPDNVTSFLGPLDSTCRHCHARHFQMEISARDDFTTCCHGGKVSLPQLEPMPELLRNLYHGQHRLYNRFKDHVLQYNYAFQFVSLEATLRDLPQGRAPAVYCIQGKVYHNISHVNVNEQRQRFGPVYFLSPEQAVDQRINNNANLNAELIQEIEILLREVNPYAAAYMHLRERYNAEVRAFEQMQRNQGVNLPMQIPNVILELLTVRGRNRRPYDLPAVNEVAAVYTVHPDMPPTPNLRVYVRNEQGRFQTLHYTNETVQPLTFPLLFPRGDAGWHPEIPHINDQRRVTLCEYYAYRLALRNEDDRFQYAFKLGQQYIVNAYVDIESNRLHYIRNNQDRLRAEQYAGLADYLHNRIQRLNEENDDAATLGRMVILPSSFIGSPRAQQQHFQDAMAVVCKYGHPSLFITMTTNPKWREITDNIPAGQQTTHHPMLISRVFKYKSDLLLTDLLELHVFGEHAANLAVYEFQKRGLPHMHDLVILKNQDRIIDPQQVDSLICAEIPDPVREPELYDIVSRNMVHNPCGDNEDAACLVDGVCSKGFPKAFCQQTTITANGRISYMRRDDGRTVTVTYQGKRYVLDNRWIVPYNPFCLLKYNCHINVEACTTADSVKYLYKYFFKGTDHALVRVAPDYGREAQIDYDEIESFLNARYMSPPEASWHILQYPTVKNTHTIYRLCVHLPRAQMVRFQPGNEAEALQRNETTHLTGWFLLNQTDPRARQYLYIEIPEHYVWITRDRRWKLRQRGGQKVITRMYSVNVRNQELYCLRVLLLNQRGATSFEDLRTVEGHVCDNFLQACQQLNLMADDVEWRRALHEASERDMPYQLRCMFAYMLIFCEITDKLALWEEFHPHFIEDFTRRGMNEEDATQRCLSHIQTILASNGTNLAFLGLPEPRIVIHDGAQIVDAHAAQVEGIRLIDQLNVEQRALFEAIMEAVHDPNRPQRLFFLNAAAGAGKSFVFRTLITALQGENIVTVACAPTGIAASLLSNGRTLHSRFKLPLDINETTTTGVTPRSPTGRYISSAKLIIIDEISMVTRSIFKIIERALRDIGDDQRPFANKVVVVGGDFRQTLPVITAGHRAMVVNECVKGSLEMHNFRTHNLLINMRARADQQLFSEWLLQLGNDTLPIYRRSHYGNLIQIPLECVARTKEELIEFCLGNLDFDFVSNKVILTPYNATCRDINDEVIDRLPGVIKTYLSADSIDEMDNPEVEYANYTVEFLNNLNFGGVPLHRLKLKQGCIVMLLRNLDLKRGLCNGTRLIIRVLGDRYLDAEKLDNSGRPTGQQVFIPRIDLITGHTTLPFKLRRRQFPVKLAYAITINKSQGQTFDRVSIYLPQPVFSHGQLYVAFSRARGFDKVKVFVENTHLQGQLNRQQPDLVYTRNVVYREVL